MNFCIIFRVRVALSLLTLLSASASAVSVASVCKPCARRGKHLSSAPQCCVSVALVTNGGPRRSSLGRLVRRSLRRPAAAGMMRAAAGFAWSAADAETSLQCPGGGRRSGGSSGGSSGASSQQQQRDADQRAKAMLREAVDAVVESFARGPQGCSRGGPTRSRRRRP